MKIGTGNGKLFFRYVPWVLAELTAFSSPMAYAHLTHVKYLFLNYFWPFFYLQITRGLDLINNSWRLPFFECGTGYQRYLHLHTSVLEGWLFMTQVGPLRECQDIIGTASACLFIIWSPIIWSLLSACVSGYSLQYMSHIWWMKLVSCSGKVLEPGFPLPSMPGIPEAPLKPAANAANAALNQLDVHSFLYAATYVGGYQEEGSSSSERPLLPPQLAPPLTTTLQVHCIYCTRIRFRQTAPCGVGRHIINQC
jgi:hypothetical protein